MHSIIAFHVMSMHVAYVLNLMYDKHLVAVEKNVIKNNNQIYKRHFLPITGIKKKSQPTTTSVIVK